MQMRHIKTSLLEVMMNFQGDLANDQEDDGTKLEPFFVGLSDDECVHEFFWAKLWLLAKVLGETHVIELIRTKDIYNF